ncbi:MAG: PAS domain-containing protein [Sandaracinaceae bacterium]|nr:PAS domain-containing protein [Sandaracinaceae bacterium]
MPRRLIVLDDDAELAMKIADCATALELAPIVAPTVAEGVRLARAEPGAIVVIGDCAPSASPAPIVEMLGPQRPAFLVITAALDWPLAARMLDLGARDCIRKDDCLFHRLPVLLRRMVSDLEREARLAAAEGALRESRELWQTFLNALPIGVFIVAADGQPFFTNQTAMRMYGREDAALEGGLAQLASHVELRREDGGDYPFDALPLVRAMRGEQAYADDIVLTLDGRRRPVEAWAAPIIDGTVRYALAAFADVTARKAAEAEVRALNASLQRELSTQTGELEATAGALRTSERRAGALFDQSTQLMLQLTPSGVVLAANRAVRAVLRHQPITGRSLVDIAGALGDAPPPAEIGRILERCVGAGEAVHFAVVSRDDSGLLRSHRRIHLQRMLGDSGSVEIVFAIVVDLTDLERAREELARAWQVAETANVAKSEFLASMSHEVRTPMTAILGFAAQLAADPSLDRRRQDDAQTIHDAGERLRGMLDRVLEMAELESTRTQVEPSIFSAATLLEQLERFCREAAEQKGLALEVAAGVPSTTIKADVGLLRHILVHVVGNAIKFTQQGRVRLDAALERRAGSQWLSIRVEDTGAGIAAEDLPRIFDAFDRGGPQNRTGGGAGLGLTIAGRLTSLLGGRLGAESELGRGSRFTVSVPVEEAGERSASAVGSGAETAGATLAAALGALQPDVRAQMRAALGLGDVARLRELIGQVRDRECAAVLGRFVEEFDYEALASLLAT